MNHRANGAIKVSSSFSYCKANTSSTELSTIFFYLNKHTATATMVAAATGIPQKNICRYKKDMEQSGILWEVRKDKCKCTVHCNAPNPRRGSHGNCVALLPLPDAGGCNHPQVTA